MKGIYHGEIVSALPINRRKKLM